MDKTTISSLPLEAVSEIAESVDFSGFYSASELNLVLETNTSANLSLVAEKKSQGEIDHLAEGDQTHVELEEPVANSTLLGTAVVPIDPAPAGDPGPDAEAVVPIDPAPAGDPGPDAQMGSMPPNQLIFERPVKWLPKD